jgi:hypothetical protein
MTQIVIIATLAATGFCAGLCWGLAKIAGENHGPRGKKEAEDE